MKKALIYLCALIAVTVMLLLFVSKNYPENLVEICLESFIAPENIANAVKNIGAYDYFNLYNIFSDENAVSVYSGNINLFLHNKKRRELILTLDEKEIIMGEKYMNSNFKYDILGEKYTSPYGEYDVNCILNGSDRVYYKDQSILNKSGIKGQILYLSLINDKNVLMYSEDKVYELQYYGVEVGESIAYKDVIDFLKKLLMLLMLITVCIIFAAIWRKNKKIYEQISNSYKNSRYDLEMMSFIMKRDNVRLIITQIFFVLLQMISVIAILYFSAGFLSIYLPFDIDITSLKSISGAVKECIDLMKYYYLNGFTDISSMIVKMAVIYFFTFILCMIIMNKFPSKNKNTSNDKV